MDGYKNINIMNKYKTERTKNVLGEKNVLCFPSCSLDHDNKKNITLYIYI